MRHFASPQFWQLLGVHYLVLATERAEDLVWFWIGAHATYDALIG